MAGQADSTEVAPFIGSGLSWPMRASGASGHGPDSEPEARQLPLFELTLGHKELDQAIYAILSTAPGERVMRPDFGCKIWGLVFAPIDDNTLGLVEYEVARALARWEPRIAVGEVSARPAAGEDHTILITISYSIKATNDVRNLVYPFYVITADPT
jgi:uncharacterized protein